MWSMIHRLCKAEVVFLSALTFFLGLSLTYFTMYYAGYGLDACRDPKTYAGDVNLEEKSLSWSNPKEKNLGREEAVPAHKGIKESRFLARQETVLKVWVAGRVKDW